MSTSAGISYANSTWESRSDYKTYGDIKIQRIKVAWAKEKISLSGVLFHASSFPPSPTVCSLSLISVLNADMKFSAHLHKPEGIGQQDTVSLPQQKNC